MRIKRWKIKKKKRRMRILGARIFSKSFGGKIYNFQTDVNKRGKKTAHAYFGRPYFFLSVLAGKFNKIEQLFTTTTTTTNESQKIKIFNRVAKLEYAIDIPPNLIKSWTIVAS